MPSTSDFAPKLAHYRDHLKFHLECLQTNQYNLAMDLEELEKDLQDLYEILNEMIEEALKKERG